MAEAADATSVAATGRDEEIGGLMEALSVSSQTPTTAEKCEYMTAASGEAAGGSGESADELRSARRAWLTQLRAECGSEEEFDTARSRPTWMQPVATAHTSSSPAELEALHAENQVHFQRLMAESASRYKLLPTSVDDTRASASSPAEEFWHLVQLKTPFFWDFGGRVEVGRRIGGGGQAEVYEALFDGQATEFVLKVFRSDSSLVQLQRLWATDVFNSTKIQEGGITVMDSCCCIVSGTMLKDGRFAFVMKRYWGDLRRAIDLQIVKDVKSCQHPPFPLSITVCIMHKIACGMRVLHMVRKRLHRDLKAANVLLKFDIEKYIEKGLPDSDMHLECDIADYETSEGVMGTRFWRAPEILCALKNKAKNMLLDPKIWTEKVDVYSYAMTSYEVLTGCILFQNHAANDYDVVIGGARSPLPDYIDPEIEELMRRCWHHEPLMRPTFEEIVRELHIFITKRREVSKDLPNGERNDEALRWLEIYFYREEYNLKSRGSG